MTINRVLPDFEQLANNILDRDELAVELQRLYEQGYYAGYYDGEQVAWVKVWDEDNGWQKDWEDQEEA